MRQPPTQPRCDLCGPEPPQCAARGWVACSPTTPLTLTEHERVSRRPPTGPGSFPKAGSPRQAVALRRAGRPGQPAAAACCCCCCTTHRCALPPGELSAAVEGWPGTSRVPLQRRRQKCGRLLEEWCSRSKDFSTRLLQTLGNYYHETISRYNFLCGFQRSSLDLFVTEVSRRVDLVLLGDNRILTRTLYG